MKKATFFDKLISTGFGSGLSPIAPGTAGALLATIIWLIIANYANTTMLLITTFVLTVIFFFLGVKTATAVESIWGHDPSRVVVDEMVGVWITLLAAPSKETSPETYLWYALAAFVLFRFFDILKPLGVRKMEALKSGWGVMMDDVLAGIYGFIVLIAARWLIA